MAVIDGLDDLSTGAWVGMGVGVLVVLSLLIACCCCCCRRRKPRKDAPPAAHYAGSNPEQYYQPPPASPEHAVDMPVPDTYKPLSSPAQNQNLSVVTGATSVGSGGHSWPTTGSSNHSHARSSGLWDDPDIVAARIPFENVQLGELLSRGGFGEVYRGSYRGQEVAVKALLPATRKDMAHIEAFLGEIKLMATLEHESIVRFVGVAWESLSELYAVSEFMGGGDLRSLLVSFRREGKPQGLDGGKARMAKQVAHALTYLHSLEPAVLHRDLKSRNVLLSRSLDARLTDFGTARQSVLDNTMTAGVGTSLWMAPEVVMGERYGDKADVFSLGVLLAEMDTHELPYARAMAGGGGGGATVGGDASETRRALPEAAVLQLVVLGRLRVDVSGQSLPAVDALVSDCVAVDPAERPTAAQALYRLHLIAKELDDGHDAER